MTQKLNWLKQYGSQNIAYTTLITPLKFTYYPQGYIAYIPLTHTQTAVLSDPIAPLHLHKKYLTSFLNQHHHCCFYHISEQCAETLNNLGLYITPFGEEHLIDTHTYNPTWKSHPYLKRQLNKAKKTTIHIQKEEYYQLTKLELETLNKHWKASKKHQFPNPNFLLRPLTLTPDTIIITARQDNTLIGIRTFDPYYNLGTVIGYYAQHTIIHPGAPDSTSVALLDYALKQFKQQNIPTCSLGLSPLSNTHLTPQPSLANNPLLSHIFNLTFRFGSTFYPFKGIEDHKNRFHAKRQKIYLASTQKLPFTNLLKTYKYTIGKNHLENSIV